MKSNVAWGSLTIKSALAVAAVATFVGCATAAKADVFTTYTVDASYNNGGGTITGTFTVDATVAATAPGGTLDLTAINLVQTGSGGINSFNFTDTGVGEQGVVGAAPDVLARMEVGAALTDQDLAGLDDLTTEPLDPEPLGVGVATVA